MCSKFAILNTGSGGSIVVEHATRAGSAIIQRREELRRYINRPDEPVPVSTVQYEHIHTGTP